MTSKLPNRNNNSLILRNGLIVFLSMLIAIVSIIVLKISINHITVEYDYIIEKCDSNIENALMIKSMLYNHKTLMYNYVNADSDAQRLYYKSEADQIAEDITPVFAKLNENLTTQDTIDCYHEMYSQCHSYMRASKPVCMLVDSGNAQVAMMELRNSDEFLVEVGEIVLKMQSFLSNEKFDAQERLEFYHSLSNRISVGIFIVLIVSLVVSVFLSVKTSRRMTDIDPLTGAINAECIRKKYNYLRLRGKLGGYILAVVNIKNFRFINRLIGSDEADRILKEFYELVEPCIRAGEFFGRYAGDTFVAVIRDDNVHEFLRSIENITAKAYADDYEETMSIPVRCGLYSLDGTDDFREAVNRATVALRNARDNVNNDVMWFESSMLDELMRFKEIENAFAKAVGEREFIVYYQPKVNMAKGSLHGAEALVRWVKDGEIIPPSTFVPVLEGDGQIEILDLYVLDCICSDIRRWLDAGVEPVRISSNFSKLHIKNPQFADNILTILKKYNIDHKYIEIELTESLGYEDHEALISFLNQMHDQGIAVSMDDFGTGYSSLTMLKDLDFDIIKLDMSFLRGFDDGNKRSVKLITNIVKMIKDLGLEVVCEGVDSDSKAGFLQSVGCIFAQGYLYDRPISKDDFSTRLNEKEYYATMAR